MVKKHRKLIILMVVGGFAICIGAVATTQISEDEEQASIDQVPPAVQTTILAEAGTGTIEEIDMETENGQTFYEADVIIDGQEVEIKVTEDGTLLGKEVDDDDDDEENEEDENEENEDEELVSFDQVPSAAQATILEEAGTGTIEEIDMETEDGQTVYEADVIIDGQEVEIKVADDGTLLGRKVEDEDDDEEDE